MRSKTVIDNGNIQTLSRQCAQHCGINAHIEGGIMRIPDGPGLGIALNEDVALEHPHQPVAQTRAFEEVYYYMMHRRWRFQSDKKEK